MLVHFVVLCGVEQSQVEFLGLGSSLANQALFLHDVQSGVYVILQVQFLLHIGCGQV